MLCVDSACSLLEEPDQLASMAMDTHRTALYRGQPTFFEVSCGSSIHRTAHHYQARDLDWKTWLTRPRASTAPQAGGSLHAHR